MNGLNRLIVVIMLCAIIPLLFMQGMFMDAAMYAAVSLNLAEGIGSFWQPVYGEHFFGLDGFYENPPLGIFTLSTFFSLFGSGFWVERLFVAFCLLLSLRAIYLNLKLFEADHQRIYWFSLLLWILMPISLWAFRHNMMEVQLTPVLLFAHWYFIRAITNKHQLLIGSFVFAIFNLAAFLIKGPVGLFLIAAPFLYWVFIQRSVQVLVFGLAALFLLIVFGLALLLIDGAPHFFDQYLFVRTAERLSNNPTVGSHFSILGELMQQLALPIVFVVLLLVTAKSKAKNLPLNSNGWYFISVACSASLPLMISLVQRPFYLLTSTPFYAIGLTLIFRNHVQAAYSFLNDKFSRAIEYLGFAGIVALLLTTYLNWGEFKRDESLFQDIKELRSILPEGESEVYVSDQVIYNWTLKAYLMRFERVDLLSIHGFDPEKSVYLLTKDDVPTTVHGSFSKLKGLKNFDVYRLK